MYYDKSGFASFKRSIDFQEEELGGKGGGGGGGEILVKREMGDAWGEREKEGGKGKEKGGKEGEMARMKGGENEGGKGRGREGGRGDEGEGGGGEVEGSVDEDGDDGGYGHDQVIREATIICISLFFASSS
jgi:hypothetical protein